MSSFDPGSSVTVDDGPMSGQFGVIVYYYAARHEYLVRFNGGAQMYFAPERIVPWGEHTS